MNSFLRYFVYFMSICLCFVILIILVETFIYKQAFRVGFLLVLLGATLIYSAGMAMFGACSTNPSVVRITEEVAQDESLEDYLTTKNRYLVESKADKKIYREKNKYRAWVSGEIIVFKENGIWFIQLPNAYVDDFKRRFQ